MVNLMWRNKLDFSGKPQHHSIDDALPAFYKVAIKMAKKGIQQGQLDSVTNGQIESTLPDLSCCARKNRLFIPSAVCLAGPFCAASKVGGMVRSGKSTGGSRSSRHRPWQPDISGSSLAHFG
jgi:hypothetical protein